jgi:hypothetical protein
MDEREVNDRANAVCERLGALAAAAVPARDETPDARSWSAIEGRLGRRVFWRPRWRVLACCSLALVMTGVWLAGRRTLAYRAENCTTTADGALLSTGTGAIAFADGSRIDLTSGTQVRVKALRFVAGAELFLDQGEARVSIVHRTGARWAVLAGPFRVDVKGTRFVVRWSSQREAFRIALQEGEVRVSGGALAGPALLRPGQTLEAEAGGAVVGPTAAPAPRPPDNQPAPLADPPYAPYAARVQPAAKPRPRSAAARARRHADDSPPSARAESTPQPKQPERTEASGAHALRTPGQKPLPPLAPTRVAPPTPTTTPSPTLRPETPPPPTVRVLPARRRIIIDPEGWLDGGMTGFAWLAGGEDTRFSTPAVRRTPARMLAKNGELCVHGTVAGLRCVNENLPQMRCNWTSNWGVQVGFQVKADGSAWGDDAARAIAVEFHGRTNRYRLNAHRSEPDERDFCIEGYQSGELAQPAMFKSKCWADQGETLTDFRNVNRFNLQLMPGLEYVAFHYCISGIEILP